MGGRGGSLKIWVENFTKIENSEDTGMEGWQMKFEVLTTLDVLWYVTWWNIKDTKACAKRFPSWRWRQQAQMHLCLRTKLHCVTSQTTNCQVSKIWSNTSFVIVIIIGDTRLKEISWICPSDAQG